MKTPKEKLKKYIKECLNYCKEQNGMPYCKNCGLDKEALELLDNIVDWKEEMEKDKKKFLESKEEYEVRQGRRLLAYKPKKYESK